MTTKQSHWLGKDWKPFFVKPDWGHEPMTANAGLSDVVKLFVELPLFPQLRACLPERLSHHFDEALIILDQQNFGPHAHPRIGWTNVSLSNGQADPRLIISRPLIFQIEATSFLKQGGPAMSGRSVRS